MSGSVVVSVSVRTIHKNVVYVAATVDGLYATDQQVNDRKPPPKQSEAWAFTEAREEDRAAFVARALRDTFPTLRHEVFSATSLPGMQGLLLAEPELEFIQS